MGNESRVAKIPLVGKKLESAGHIFIDRKNPVAAKKKSRQSRSANCVTEHGCGFS